MQFQETVTTYAISSLMDLIKLIVIQYINRFLFLCYYNNTFGICNKKKKKITISWNGNIHVLLLDFANHRNYNLSEKHQILK